ncbi:copper homeostasis protein CutC [Paenibacillus luteus]|uniref:copper homeostasis protein CutC n=1 Tax=Paenibacillus luteus TaxID=2545753 RepID=UPI001143E6C9|nr:copper homeostasis protein CutC [Paenibacillus luteus]
MLLEIIATTADEAVTAVTHGADRVELISAFDQGGLSPSEAQITSVLNALNKLEQTIPNHKTIPVHAMIRPHSKSFVYGQADLNEMVQQIAKMRSLGVHAFVLGTLDANGMIDTVSMERLLEAAGDRPVTFHRAFDEAADQEEALFTLMKYPQIKWILTSGGQPSVLNAVDEIKRLIELSSDHGITIMPGSGISIASLPDFISATGARAVHLGTGVRTGGVHSPIDGSLVMQACQVLKPFL